MSTTPEGGAPQHMGRAPPTMYTHTHRSSAPSRAEHRGRVNFVPFIARQRPHCVRLKTREWKSKCIRSSTESHASETATFRGEEQTRFRADEKST